VNFRFEFLILNREFKNTIYLTLAGSRQCKKLKIFGISFARTYKKIVNHYTFYMTDQKIEMTTLSTVLEKLRDKKFDKEFQMTSEGFTPGNNKYYTPEDLKIIRTYRFEGDSDRG
jgi:hypothetical protein